MEEEGPRAGLEFTGLIRRMFNRRSRGRERARDALNTYLESAPLNVLTQELYLNNRDRETPPVNNNHPLTRDRNTSLLRTRISPVSLTSPRSSVTSPRTGVTSPVSEEEEDMSSSPRRAAGGYPDEIFSSLTQQEREDAQCNICLLVARDPFRCEHGHLFCGSCLRVWRQSCPVCRSGQPYSPAPEVTSRLAHTPVTCAQDGCTWRGVLQDHDRHLRQAHRPLAETMGLTHAHLPSIQLGMTSPRGLPLELDTYSRRGRDRALAAMTSRVTSRRRAVDSLMTELSQRLAHRREELSEYAQLREQRRRAQLQEVNDLSLRLSDVSTNLTQLLDNMAADSARYQGYIRDLPEEMTESGEVGVPGAVGDTGEVFDLGQFNLYNNPSYNM